MTKSDREKDKNRKKRKFGRLAVNKGAENGVDGGDAAAHDYSGPL